MLFDYAINAIDLFAQSYRTDEFAQFSLNTRIVYAKLFIFIRNYYAFF